MDLSENERNYLNSQPLGRLATLAPDGSPQSCPSDSFSTRHSARSTSADTTSDAARSSAMSSVTVGSHWSSMTWRRSTLGHPVASRSEARQKP